MPARLTRLRTRADRQRDAEAGRIRQLVLEFPELRSYLEPRKLAALTRDTAARNGWTFLMLSPQQNLAVVEWLHANSSRARAATRLWAHLFVHLDHDTGQIHATRDELAEAVGITPSEVSIIITELVTLGAVTRWYEPVPGMRGKGALRIAMNPLVATKLSTGIREDAQRQHRPVAVLDHAR